VEAARGIEALNGLNAMATRSWTWRPNFSGPRRRAPRIAACFDFVAAEIDTLRPTFTG